MSDSPPGAVICSGSTVPVRRTVLLDVLGPGQAVALAHADLVEFAVADRDEPGQHFAR